MGRAHSIDLRERVVAAVDKGRMSRRRAAVQCRVSINTIITWVRRFREIGGIRLARWWTQAESDLR
jgi:transposase